VFSVGVPVYDLTVSLPLALVLGWSFFDLVFSVQVPLCISVSRSGSSSRCGAGSPRSLVSLSCGA
jgi:hypothetical protein